MGLETGNTINDLNESWPLGTDPKSQGDDHIRLCKRVFKNDVLSITNGGTISGDLTIGGAFTSKGIDDNASANALTIDTSGNVGIGTNSPAEKFQVSGGAIFQQGAGNHLGVFRETQFAKLAIGTDIDNCVYFQDAGTQNLTIGRSISGVSTESMRIDSSGNLLVGTTYGSFNARQIIRFEGTGSSDHGLAVWNGGAVGKKFVQFVNTGGAEIGSITQSSATDVAYNTTSDYRLKEDIQPMTDATTRLMSLNPVNFAWKVDGSRTDGFIAHEAQAVVPQAVSGEKDAVDVEGNPEYQGIDQSKLVPLLVATVQELVKRIKDLEGNP
jgi:hypothetical protein